jgi:hypothetical protein
LVYAADVNLLGNNINTINYRIGTSTDASIEFSLKLTVYCSFVTRMQAKIHDTKRENMLFESVPRFKYLGKTPTNQNPIYDEIKMRLNSGNVCYHSVQNLLSCGLLSTNLKIRI